MKRLSEYGNHELEDGTLLTKEDVLNLYRLQKQLLIEKDIVVTLGECESIWQNHSWDVAASWLTFPEDDNSILREIEIDDSFKTWEGLFTDDSLGVQIRTKPRQTREQQHYIKRVK